MLRGWAAFLRVLSTCLRAVGFSAVLHNGSGFTGRGFGAQELSSRIV